MIAVTSGSKRQDTNREQGVEMGDTYCSSTNNLSLISWCKILTSSGVNFTRSGPGLIRKCYPKG